jgi:hypothetical protein
MAAAAAAAASPAASTTGKKVRRGCVTAFHDALSGLFLLLLGFTTNFASLLRLKVVFFYVHGFTIVSVSTSLLLLSRHFILLNFAAEYIALAMSSICSDRCSSLYRTIIFCCIAVSFRLQVPVLLSSGGELAISAISH